MAQQSILTLLYVVVAAYMAAGAPATFKVGVLDMASYHSWNVTTRQGAMSAMEKNLDLIDHYTGIAHAEGAKMIVFPEYGLTGWMGGPGDPREQIYPFMETLTDYPSPVNGTCPVNCSAEWRHALIHAGVSCIAMEYKMYVIVNMIESRPCEILQDHHCPADNHYLYNTNAVYNPNGCLIAKYHKLHLVEHEPSMLDAPRHPEMVYFDTEFGRFGTIICADGLYKEPKVDLVEKYNIDHLIYPMAWQNDITQPYLRPNEWQFAIAARHNISVISANMHDVKKTYMGSGIYRSNQVLNFSYNAIPQQSTLLTAELPILSQQQNPKLPIPVKPHPSMIKQQEHIEKTTPPPDGHVNFLGDTYNTRVLNGSSGMTSVCHNGLCCSLEFTRNSTEEFFVLAAFKGEHTLMEDMGLENCVVYKCAQDNLKSCSISQELGETAFKNFHLSATFTTQYVYPSILPSGLAYDKFDWRFYRPNYLQNAIKASSDWPLVAASLIGMDY